MCACGCDDVYVLAKVHVRTRAREKYATVLVSQTLVHKPHAVSSIHGGYGPWQREGGRRGSSVCVCTVSIAHLAREQRRMALVRNAQFQVRDMPIYKGARFVFDFVLSHRAARTARCPRILSCHPGACGFSVCSDQHQRMSGVPSRRDVSRKWTDTKIEYFINAMRPTTTSNQRHNTATTDVETPICGDYNFASIHSTPKTEHTIAVFEWWCGAVRV